MNLKTEWEMIRRELFPRWDLAKKWKCRLVDDADDADGKCLRDRKIIKLVLFTEETLLLLLVHEICHAVAGDGHGAKWQARMAVAAKRAKDIGMKSLAVQIRNEVRGYKNSPQVTAADIYERMGEVVRCCRRDISFKDAAQGIAYEYGMSPREVLSKYPRLRAVYDQSVAEKIERAVRLERIRQAEKEIHP